MFKDFKDFLSRFMIAYIVVTEISLQYFYLDIDEDIFKTPSIYDLCSENIGHRMSIYSKRFSK